MNFWSPNACKKLAITSIAVTVVAGCGAPQNLKGWIAKRSQDPVSGVSRCVVTKPDQFSSLLYTRTFTLYPVIEENPKYGLLVGVSSGGNFVVPVGDILWRVDQNKPNSIKAQETPSSGPAYGGVNVNALVSGSTMASGKKARSMLEELKSGTSLIFRQDLSQHQIGLPRSSILRVGEISGGKLQALELGASFRKALTDCGL